MAATLTHLDRTYAMNINLQTVKFNGREFKAGTAKAINATDCIDIIAKQHNGDDVYVTCVPYGNFVNIPFAKAQKQADKIVSMLNS